MNVNKERQSRNLRRCTYTAATEITYRDTKIRGTLVIKVIAVGSSQVVVELEGENGISLNGILKKAGFDENQLVLRGIVAIDFGAGLGKQKLDSALGFTVEDGALTQGQLFLGDQFDLMLPNGKFAKAELVRRE